MTPSEIKAAAVDVSRVCFNKSHYAPDQLAILGFVFASVISASASQRRKDMSIEEFAHAHIDNLRDFTLTIIREGVSDGRRN